MPSYTLLCGHTFDLTDLVRRAITHKPGRDICPVCKTPFDSYEGSYLAYVDTTKITLAEYISSEEEYLARRSAELAKKPLMPTCSGTCNTGKKCTKTAMRSNGVFCNLHV